MTAGRCVSLAKFKPITQKPSSVPCLAVRGDASLGLRGLTGPARLSDHESGKQAQWLEVAHALNPRVTTSTSRRTDRSPTSRQVWATSSSLCSPASFTVVYRAL
jgi:hypothetical protein